MTHKPNISKNERSAASNRWRHAANIKHGLAIIAFVACILPASNLCGQNIAIKSNLLYDLTTTLNMGGEVRCDDTHTISLSLNYNPWNFGGNKKMKHFLLQPEYRKWKFYRLSATLCFVQFWRNAPLGIQQWENAGY